MIAQQDTEGPNIRLLHNFQYALDENLATIEFWPMLDVKRPTRAVFWLQASIKTSNNITIPYANLVKLAAATHLELKFDRWMASQAQQHLKKLRQSELDAMIFTQQSGGALQSADYATWLNRQQLLQDVTNEGLVLCFRLSEILKDIKNAMGHIAALRSTGAKICITRFQGMDAAIKLAQLLKVNFIALHPNLHTATPEVLKTLVRDIDRSTCQIIMKEIEQLNPMSLAWAGHVDYLSGSGIQKPVSQPDFRFPATLTS